MDGEISKNIDYCNNCWAYGPRYWKAINNCPICGQEKDEEMKVKLYEKMLKALCDKKKSLVLSDYVIDYFQNLNEESKLSLLEKSGWSVYQLYKNVTYDITMEGL